MKNLKTTSLLLVTGLCAFASMAHAETLIDITDTLTGSGYLAYDQYGHGGGGSYPPVEIGSSSIWQEDAYAQWTRSATGSTSNITPRESYGQPDSSAIGDAYLNVPTVAGGGIYTLSVTVSAAAGDNVELGFIDVETDGLPRINDVNGPNLSVTPGNNDPVTLSLILNTTGPNWTLEAFDNDVQQGSTYTYSTNPTGLDGVEMASNSSYPVFSGFSYTEITAPEPSTWALMVLGAASLGFYFRQRSRRA